MIYIAQPNSQRGITSYIPCWGFGTFENDIDAIRKFLLEHYGDEWLSNKSETEMRNHFYASGYILKYVEEHP